MPHPCQAAADACCVVDGQPEGKCDEDRDCDRESTSMDTDDISVDENKTSSKPAFDWVELWDEVPEFYGSSPYYNEYTTLSGGLMMEEFPDGIRGDAGMGEGDDTFHQDIMRYCREAIASYEYHSGLGDFAPKFGTSSAESSGSAECELGQYPMRLEEEFIEAFIKARSRSTQEFGIQDQIDLSNVQKKTGNLDSVYLGKNYSAQEYMRTIYSP